MVEIHQSNVGEYKIIFYGDVPSKKNGKKIAFRFVKMINAKMFIKVRGVMRGVIPFITSSKRHEEWERKAVCALCASMRLQNIETALKTPVIVFEAFPGTRHRADLSNKVESIMDALVTAKLIEDDNWFICSDIHMKFGGVDKENPRFVLTVRYT